MSVKETFISRVERMSKDENSLKWILIYLITTPRDQ